MLGRCAKRRYTTTEPMSEAPTDMKTYHAINSFRNRGNLERQWPNEAACQYAQWNKNESFVDERQSGDESGEDQQSKVKGGRWCSGHNCSGGSGPWPGSDAPVPNRVSNRPPGRRSRTSIAIPRQVGPLDRGTRLTTGTERSVGCTKVSQSPSTCKIVPKTGKLFAEILAFDPGPIRLWVWRRRQLK